jgi:pSer/pThr/pTyr-binding forkhead associated (FHA) protein
MGSCPACGAEVQLGRLTGILGVVCRACDAYNEPGATSCAGCGKPLDAAAEPAADEPASPPSRPAPLAAPTVAAVPPPGTPVVRSVQKPARGAVTRFVPSVLRPSPDARPPAPAASGAGPIPLVATCPRCGARAGTGRFCAQCGQPLGAHGTRVMLQPSASAPATPPGIAELAPGRARLVVEGGAQEGTTFPLGEGPVEAGRSKGAIRFPEDPTLAPHHATFFHRGGAFFVRDEGGPGGIYLRLRGLSAPLRAGDHFAVGERLLRYAGQLPPAPAPPPDGTRRLGAPRPAPPAVIVEEWLEGGAGGRVFVRTGPTVTIGRGGCAVSLGDDPHVSQAHCELVVERDGTARLRDLGSSNGTYVRVPPRAERELRDGDFVRMGRAVLRVAAEG